MSSEMQMSIAASSMFPGFRFSPTDDELISYYLKKKLDGAEKCVEVIPEVEIWKHEPWDLPAKSIIQSENEWFFFSPRGRKYPNGSQSKRATESGYWKATGKERNVKSGSKIITGTKRTLVFHTGRAPKGERTEWIMHEYCMSGNSQDVLVVCRLRKNSEFRLNETPRQQGSRGQVSASTNNFSVSEIGGRADQSVLSGGGGAKECSKECTSSSNNSHSVEQQIFDSEFESDHRQHPFEFCQPNSSSSHMKEDCDEEEDCFADIMNDDIVKLDEPPCVNTSSSMVSSSSEAAAYKRKSKQPVESIMQSVLPFQGTASRRIRLRCTTENGTPTQEVIHLKFEQSRKFFLMRRLAFHFITVFCAVMLILLLSTFLVGRRRIPSQMSV